MKYIVKYAGMIGLIISSTTLGLLSSSKQKQRVDVCSTLIDFCDALLIDLEYALTPVTTLVNKLLVSKKYESISFISVKNIKVSKQIKSCLSESENAQITSFLFSLGKSDANAQIKLIKGFREYIVACKDKYDEAYNKGAKLSVAFGFFGGVIISLVLV